MLKNYLIIAIRNLLRHKAYSFINISGLVIGMTCVFLTGLFIREELSYDNQHQHPDQIYRVVVKTVMKGSNTLFHELTSGGLGPELREQIPEVRSVVKTMRWDNWVKYENKVFNQIVCFADENIFEVFNFPLARGNTRTVLTEPAGILLTRDMAHKYFGTTDPIGKTITIEGSFFSGDYKITGILENTNKSTLRFDFLISKKSMPRLPEAWLWWHAPTAGKYIETYVVLPKGFPKKEVEKKLLTIVAGHWENKIDAEVNYYLQPLQDIYLYSNRDYGLKRGGYNSLKPIPYGDIKNVITASLIALFILLIACVNFMSLSTARSANRAKEVGMRKVVGAYRSQLVYQFLSESILVSFIALFISLVLVHFLLPAFSTLIGIRQMANIDLNLSLFLLPVLFALGVGIIAGSYPAFFLSAFQPIAVLKSARNLGSKRSWFRKSLVVFQFSISILLIISTLIAYRQIEYINNKDLGFNSKQVLVTPIFHAARDSGLWGGFGMELKHRYNTVKQAFLEHPDVLEATVSRFTLGSYTALRPFRAEGMGNKEWRMNIMGIDEDFLKFYRIDLLQGRNFSKAYAEMNFEERAQKGLEFILNEAAVKQFGWRMPVGKKLTMNNEQQGTVIGVVKDFHFKTLHTELEPVVLIVHHINMKYAHLKIQSRDLSGTLKSLETIWKQFIPNRPFEFSFLDADLDSYYRTELKLAQTFGIFSFIAIFISTLGLLGLASFAAEQRTKEIGIRKVLGASVTNIFYMLSLEFVKLILISNLIAWPIAYYAMENWLRDFAYRTTIDLGPFLLGGLITLIVTLAAISFRTLKAAIANPVDTLRYE